MKKAFLTTIVILGYGCQSAPTTPESRPALSSGCPAQPSVELKKDNVTEISLGKAAFVESGQINADKTLGYIFLAQAGQTLSYQFNGDICQWIFTPNNQFLLKNNVELKQAGKYIIQISPRIGKQNFELKLILESPQSPEEMIEIYYNNVNTSKYAKSWQLLTSEFKKDLNYQDYQTWWNRVEKAEVNDVEILNQTDEVALVKANLKYHMSNGRIFQDSKPFFHLVWDKDKKHWLIDRKTFS